MFSVLLVCWFVGLLAYWFAGLLFFCPRCPGHRVLLRTGGRRHRRIGGTVCNCEPHRGMGAVKQSRGRCDSVSVCFTSARHMWNAELMQGLRKAFIYFHSCILHKAPSVLIVSCSSWVFWLGLYPLARDAFLYFFSLPGDFPKEVNKASYPKKCSYRRGLRGNS